ncbi:MAG: methyltransferase [Propionibacteriaceae bacterium]|nr:methyltransferase [Propionibacteriaceae bacterium]
MDFTGLRELLLAHDHTTDAVLERIGETGQAGLGRNSTVPADVALAEELDPQAVLIRLFLLQQAVALAPVEATFGPCLADLLEAEVLGRSGDEVRALVDLRPYGSPDDGASGWLVSDLTPGLDGAVTPPRPDYVLGASPASLTLAQITMRTPVGRALDLGTGCGVQSFHLSRHSQQVVATDLNPRALRLARFGAALSGMDIDFREGSLFGPVGDDGFDLIVSNPPYVMSPPDDQRLTYRESTFLGDGLVEAIVRQAPAHLNPGGSLQLLTNWAIPAGQQWEDRLASWAVGSGCDLLALERERLDRFTYIEMWLTDAGLAGTSQWEPAYRRWLDYFERLDIDEVGLGWLLLTNSGRTTPDIRCESWPHAVAQPVGAMFAAHAQALDAARLPEAELLELSPALGHVVLETTGQPGAADPEHLVLRQRTGLLRGLQLTTATGAVLGALDGDLSVGRTIAAVAHLLGQPAAEVAAEVLPVVRQALAEQYLRASAIVPMQ